MTGDLSDEEIDASLALSDALAESIERLFNGHRPSDCIMALAKVFGCAVAREPNAEPKEAFKEFFKIGAVEMHWERGRSERGCRA